MRQATTWTRGLLGSLLWACLWTAAVAQQKPVEAAPDLAVILERNAQARGGVEAWRRIGSMVWAGHVEVASRPDQNLPFMLEQKRPARSRFEIIAGPQKSVRTYNGKEGWRSRSSGLSKPELQAYSEEELRFAHDTPVIDGVLMDSVAKGYGVRMAGDDLLEGRPNYVLDVALPDGVLHRVWVDAQTYLESRLDRAFRKATGQTAMTTVRYRDYHTFEGLQMPVTVETGGQPGAEMGGKLVIERVALNPELGDALFERPGQQAAGRRSRITVDARSAANPKPPLPMMAQ